MEENYAVTVCGKHTGKVTVRREGLYYAFSCRCMLDGNIIYRLIVTCGAKREKLGILVPKDGGFGLDTKLPVKRIGEGELSFMLLPKQDSFSGVFIPIYPEEPFSYLSRLKESFLILQNGQPGICIKNVQER